MKVIFEHDGHKIVLSRGIVTSELSIDSEICDTCNGFTNNQLKSFALNGTVVDSDGNKKDIRVSVDCNFLNDNVSLYYAGKLIETKKITLF